MYLKKNCIAMLLAGGQGSRLGVLTKRMAKPAIPFGGKYRIIDFPLSNCINSGIDTVGVLTQYQPYVLNSYIGNGQPWDMDRIRGGVSILPPYVRGKDGEWYTGTANAIYQNINYIDMNDPEYVLLLSGDHIYKMDYDRMLREHVANKADATIAVLEVPMQEASRFGIMNADEDGRITEFEEKPKHPKSNKASMGIYIFTWKKLRHYLELDEQDPNSSKDFGKNIIPRMLADGQRMMAYNFSGYWKDVGTIDSLWEANMDLLKPNLLNLHDDGWRIYSRTPAQAPHYVGSDATVENSLLTEGSVVNGDVRDSVIFHGARIAKGAVVRKSIVMPDAVIGEDAVVEYAIVGENAKVGAKAVIGGPPRQGDPQIAVVGPDITVEDCAIVKPGEMMSADVAAR
ncbi:MAG: glucose-1-phosphate adenylyltransferase [Eubacteriales bacterium]|nr:glucose-1-phosphate adenylyltransferase [Eubacteriales bacterium]